MTGKVPPLPVFAPLPPQPTAEQRKASRDALIAGLVAMGFKVFEHLMLEYRCRKADEQAALDAAAQAELDLDEQEEPCEPEPTPLRLPRLRRALECARILGVSPYATADQIRAALRAKLAAARIHPDQGGDGEEARRLIDARNFLLEWAKEHE